VIALISGGGSALLPAPPAGVSLDDKRALNALLLASGLDIMAMNLIRQQVSDLKGGGFLRLAAPAPVTAYILSDVIGDDLRAIASGPTVAPLGTRIEAATHLKSAGLWDRLPGAIRSHLGAPEPDRSPPPEATNHLIGSNRQSAEAAAQACRDAFDATLVEAPLVGDVADAAETVVRAARHALASPRPSALIWGGETTVVPTGPGLGGRNQELALRIAARTADLPGPVPWVFLSGGTDGRDGPTDAAGGLVDPQTADRLRRAGVDVARALADNDSNTALSASGDLVITGATGTNVADIQVFLTGGPAR
jgi:glycerate 2-kinase